MLYVYKEFKHKKLFKEVLQDSIVYEGAVLRNPSFSQYSAK